MSLTSSLQTHFGFDSFRAGQEEAIQALLNKQHTLAIMPTGAGKSLIFQFAALQLDGITLVISPLIALMKDQVDSLIRRNIPASYINSALPASPAAIFPPRTSTAHYSPPSKICACKIFRKINTALCTSRPNDCETFNF